MVIKNSNILFLSHILTYYSLIFFTVQSLSLSILHPTTSHSSSPCPRICLPTPPDFPTPWGHKSLKGQVPFLSLRLGHQEFLCYMCILGLIQASVCCLVGGSVSERSWGSRLVETAGPPIGQPSSASSSFLLIQTRRSPASVHWLDVNICI